MRKPSPSRISLTLTSGMKRDCKNNPLSPGNILISATLSKSMMKTAWEENRSRNTELVSLWRHSPCLIRLTHDRSLRKAQEKIGCNNFNRLRVYDLLKVSIWLTQSKRKPVLRGWCCRCYVVEPKFSLKALSGCQEVSIVWIRSLMWGEIWHET